MQNCTNRLSGRYENILWGVKNIDNYVFNLNDVRIPYITKNDKRLAEGGGRNPTDVWYFDRVNNMTKKKLNLTHPTIYPLPMIVRIVKMATNPGDIVLDPFAGSGTSLVAAKIMGRSGIGFELDKKYKEECMRRLETSRPRFDEFFENVRTFENQFCWNEYNEQCYDYFYRNNSYDDLVTVGGAKEAIPEMKEMCSNCAAYFTPKRNESIPQYDVLLGKQIEEEIMPLLLYIHFDIQEESATKAVQH